MTKPGPLTQKQLSLVENNLDLVRVIALALMARLPASIEFDDLYQAGSIGLMTAARKFDETMESYGNGVLFRAFASRRVRGAMLDSIRRDEWRHANHEPMEAALYEIAGEDGSGLDRAIQQAEHARIIQQAAEGLPAREAKVVDIYFYQEQKLRGVAREFGVKQSRSSQLLQSAKRHMARELAWRGVKAA